jgi:molybdopterin adenylyltransferase
MTHHLHRRAAPRRVVAAVLTVSDTRTAANDISGALIRRLLSRAGHRVESSAILPDEPARIRRLLRTWAGNPGIQAILLTGGTGISPRDGTYEAVESLLEKRLEGFGEIFRLLSYRQVGPAAILSRAVAGSFRGRILFSLPGSERAVELAMRRIILPELGHLVGELSKSPAPPSGRRGFPSRKSEGSGGGRTRRAIRNK